MKWLRSFGRLKGRNYKNSHLIQLEELLDDALLIKPDKFNFHESEIILEIGFGYGEHIAKQALLNPDKIFIGAEVYIKGLLNVFKKIKDENIKNILLWNQDARILLEMIPDHILTKIFLLFPDPWPKKRHHKRRIINQDFLKLVKSKLKRTGEMIVATDHFEYAQYIEEEVKKVFAFETIDINAITTKYKEKSNTIINSYRVYNV